MVEPRGGGGSGAVVLAVALLAGFLFIGGAAAIYVSQPQGTADPTDIAFASGSPTLPPFVQPTATPGPTPSPTFILLPSDSPTFFPSFSPLPTDTFGFPTAPPTVPPTVGPTQPPHTPGPTTPTPAPTAQAVQAKFSCTQQGTTKKINCQNASTGPITSWHWDFGDGSTFDGANPGQKTYAAYKSNPGYTVSLVVTGPNGQTSFKQKNVDVTAPPCDDQGGPEGCIATPPPTPSAPPTTPPSPTPEPTATPAPTTAPASSAVQATATPAPDVTPTP